MNGVTINGKHSYHDYNMLLQPKSIPLPKAKVTTVQIQGADGQLDVSTALTDGNMRYSNREIKLGFIHIGVNSMNDEIAAFYAAIHGQTLEFTFDDDPQHYFVGLWQVTDVEANNGYTVLTVEISAEPYRYDVEPSIITKTVDGAATVIAHNGRKWVTPTITSDAEMIVQFEGVIYQVLEGKHINDNIVLRDGDNLLAFEGNGTVIIEYRQGVL